jgi:hypothetical protein
LLESRKKGYSSSEKLSVLSGVFIEGLPCVPDTFPNTIAEPGAFSEQRIHSVFFIFKVSLII